MPMLWTPEADVKLLRGILLQIKETGVKLDIKQLSEFMGPECNVGAVKNRLSRLRTNADGSVTEDSGSSAPAYSPPKRKSGSSPLAPKKKKTVTGKSNDTGSEISVEVPKKADFQDDKDGH
ncbi:hypothetical protein NUU61_007349 [Penicillium alfredii]|uniref:Uncharacterized protein n=1 Tax=Penicillium alfredii TaxID=1506179 RepID=A0A9W9F2Q5_9EURO|nr:uncharacterized protein NUU61_007349 [Penicillium alfredii]KAJ5092479.1 hypothetical protein NUU61_007349 [Penicillium alfredii]